MEPPVAATLTTAAGIGLHLASPTIAYVVGRSARIRKRISPEHAYDLFTTIGAALCLFALLELSIFPVGQILTFGLLFGLMAGAVAPLALWRAYGKTPTIRRPTPRTISWPSLLSVPLRKRSSGGSRSSTSSTMGSTRRTGSRLLSALQVLRLFISDFTAHVQSRTLLDSAR